VAAISAPDAARVLLGGLHRDDCLGPRVPGAHRPRVLRERRRRQHPGHAATASRAAIYLAAIDPTRHRSREPTPPSPFQRRIVTVSFTTDTGSTRKLSGEVSVLI
jgi:hypothetical protein